MLSIEWKYKKKVWNNNTMWSNNKKNGTFNISYEKLLVVCRWQMISDFQNVCDRISHFDVVPSNCIQLSLVWVSLFIKYSVSGKR